MTRQWKWVSLIIVSLTASACSSIIPGNLNKTSTVAGTARPSTVGTTLASTSTPGSPAETPLPATVERNKRAAFEAFQAVMNNKKEFQSTDNKKTKYLKDFLSNNEVYGTTTAIDRFAVVDMDGDGVPELVLGLTVENEADFTEVMHYQGGEVYGFFFGRDQIVELKSDGSYRWLSGGVTNNGYDRLTFKADAAEPEKLAYLESRPLDDASTTFATTYYLKDQTVTKESYAAFVAEQDAKQNVTWHQLTKANIDKWIATSADSQKQSPSPSPSPSPSSK
jgi:hypothetical protein